MSVKIYNKSICEEYRKLTTGLYKICSDKRLCVENYINENYDFESYKNIM